MTYSVSTGLRKVSTGLRKVPIGLRKVPIGLRKVPSSFLFPAKFKAFHKSKGFLFK